MKRYGYKVLIAGWIFVFTSACLAQYNPVLGRFHQRDPLGIRPAQATFVNGAPYLAGNGVIPGSPRTRLSPTYAVAMVQPDPVASIKTPSGIAPAKQYQDGMSSYEYVKSKPLHWYDPYGLNSGDPNSYLNDVQVCCSKANVCPVGNELAWLCGYEHCWLKTQKIAAGMGGADNAGGKNSSPSGTPTQIVDHSGRKGRCWPITSECDPACVERHLQIGKPLGKWSTDNI